MEWSKVLSFCEVIGTIISSKPLLVYWENALLNSFCYFFIFSYFFKTFPERMNMSGGGGGAGGQPSDHGQQKLESLLFKVSISGYCLSYRTVGRKK